MKKISIVGAGNTGATAAHWLAERELANVVLLDVVEGMPQGKGLDLLEAMPIIGRDAKVVGTNDYADTKDSDIVIITAGIARKPGMSRDDLLKTNAEIVGKAATETLKYSPNAIFIVLTNPLDTMAYLVMKKTACPAPASSVRLGFWTPPVCAPSWQWNQASAWKMSNATFWADTATRWFR